MRRLVTLTALTLALLAGGCASTPRPATTPVRAGVADAGPRAVIESVEPWEFAGAPGQIITTPNFRIFTTETNPTLLDRMPAFLETALDHYTRALVLLPRPERRMETFLMDTRAQWQRLTLQILGQRGQSISRVGRGGFAHGGRGVFFDIGVFDTLAIASHEGWHQYTQSTFRERLPAWAEESVATYMEGHRWAGATPVFLPWSNVERFDHLRKVHAEGRLLPLRRFLASTPEDLLTPVNEDLLTYYAQGWALIHFLHSQNGEASRASLQRLLSDAQAGRLGRAVGASMTPEARATFARDSSGLGEAVFMAYFGTDLDGLEGRYRAFVAELVGPGARDRIVAGESPRFSSGR
ncbi:MAG: DUF1570 domain-containing protein [Phycisphaeraceae bacterium]|nr:DUF1570 domain-containing protein [Phycisphaeraceae bacterium]